MCIQVAGDDTEGELTETSVNLSAGGIGVMVTTDYKFRDVLSLTLLLPIMVAFKPLSRSCGLIHCRSLAVCIASTLASSG